MKHNGQNIITDKDITMTGNGFQGEELSGILTDHQDRLDTLESNVKWIYKNGGVGSGSGGGGGSQTSWKVIISSVDTGQTLVNNGTINFPKPGPYAIQVKIYGGGSDSFQIKYVWPNSQGQPQTRTSRANADNSFTVVDSLNLAINGTISITVENQSTFEPYAFTVNYIVSSYSFSVSYVYKDNKQSFNPGETHNIYMSQVKTHGLLVALTYNISVDLLSNGYTFVDWMGNKYANHINLEDPTYRDEGYIDFHTDDPAYEISGRSSGTIYLPLVPDEDGGIEEFLSDDENARFVSFSLTLHIKLDGNTEEEKIDTFLLEDSLIPSDIYLKVSTSSGGLYPESQLIPYTTPDNPEIQYRNNYPIDRQFSIGNAVFQLTPYYGPRIPGRPFTLSITLNGDPYNTNIRTLLDQTTQSVLVRIDESGEYCIKFRITADDASKEWEYWFFVKESTSNFDWYSNQNWCQYNSYYRKFNDVKGIPNLTKASAVQMYANSPTTTYQFTLGETPPQSYSGLDQLLCLGIQLSSVNESNLKIASFNCSSPDRGTITIYQNKVVFSNGNSLMEAEIFLPLVDELDEVAKTNYHLLSIYKKFDYSYGTNIYRRIFVYLDGVLEAAFESTVSVHYRYESITFYPGNYYINLIENSCFDHMSNSSPRTWLRDNDMIRYYYSYQEKIIENYIDDTDVELFRWFDSEDIVLTDDNYVKVNENIIQNIANSSKVPVLMVSYTDEDGGARFGKSQYNNDNLKDWMQQVFPENIEILRVPVRVSWSEGGSQLSEITRGDGSAASFYITPQGSSTLGYRCKNWELIAPASTDPTTRVCIYSPNFSFNDPNSFLPEESFTLKADVVDSSHTNNNAIGDFVNKVTTPFNKARQQSSSLSDHIKNCLTGFPILMFLASSYKVSSSSVAEIKTNYYFLGIYNFNLGRQSYYNLGYKNLSNLSGIQLTSGFNLYEIDKTDTGIPRNVGVAEIQGNNPLFDFSQSDASILFPIAETDNTYMFGDLVGQETRLQVELPNLLHEISRAGGYTFDTVGKNYKDYKGANDRIGYGYDEQYSAEDSEGTSLNQVPNYRYHAVRSLDGGTMIYTFTNWGEGEAKEQDLVDLIIGDLEEPRQKLERLDYTSLCEYYTICMAFGLVDSVQKNLNIKTWNLFDEYPLWYLAFYDMDTCLGVSNSGARVSYFAFSDYWESSSNTSTTPPTLGPVKIYRDYSPKPTDVDNSGLYDIPSSYIFAIAKYAYFVFSEGSDLREKTKMHPSNLWGYWRQGSESVDRPQQGCLQNADYFLRNYYIHHLSGVPLSAFNYNYIYKYLVKSIDDSGNIIRDQNGVEHYDSTNFPKFYGRKIYYTQDWLNGRFHLLDAYFNINKVTEEIAPGTGISAPYTDDYYQDRNNSDIYVFKDIFNQGSGRLAYSNLNYPVTINAKPFAPLILELPNSTERYLFPESGDDCLLNFVSYGNQQLTFGGSALWESISTINPFITANGRIQITSKYFSNIVGTAKTCNSWSFTTPALKTISLKHSNYSGDLDFSTTGSTTKYPNLSTIDISGSKINLIINIANITEIKANNTVGGSIIVTNIDTLTNVELTNAKLSSLTIPAWKRVIELTSLTCPTISIDSNIPNAELVVRNNSALTKLTARGFSKVSISNCNSLEYVVLGSADYNPSPLKELSITSSGSTFKMSETTGVVDLSSHPSLEKVTFQNATMTTVILPNHRVDLPYHAFYRCHNLEYLNGGGNGVYYYLTGSSVFEECESFTLKQSDGSWCNIKPDTTNLNNTFYIPDQKRGSINLDGAQYFLETCCGNYSGDQVTSANYLFYGQNILYTKQDFIDEYTSSTPYCSLSLKNLRNCTSFNRTFYNNNIYAYNRYMFSGLIGSSIAIEGIIGMNWNKTWEENYNDLRLVYATTDFLYEILPRLSSFRGHYYDDGNLRYSFIDMEDTESYSYLETLNLKDVFNDDTNSVYPEKLTSLVGFDVDTRHMVNFSGVFNSNWIRAISIGLTISDFFCRTTYSNIVSDSLNGFLYSIPIKSAPYLLNGITSSFVVDMSNFLNWERLDICTNLFYSQPSNQGFNGSLNFSKQLTRDRFLYIWKKILSDYKGVGLGCIFRNCKIIDWQGDKFYLIDENDSSIVPNNYINEYISYIPYLFSNCRAYSSPTDTFPIYLSLDSNFMKYLPSITNAYYSFYGTYWKHTVPFDFFQKRKEIESGVYVLPEGSNVISQKQPAKLYTYRYNQEIMYIQSCFSNISLDPREPKGFDPLAEYNCGKLDPSSPNKMITRVVDDENHNYQSYYNQPNSSSAINLIIPPEETDLDNLIGTYVASVTTPAASKVLSNVPIGSNITQDQLNRLFISPDVLYGCTPSCYIEGVFANTRSMNEAIYNQNEYYVFTGIIPEHLLDKVRSSSISNIFQWLNIIPRKLGETVVDGITEEHYYYVPRNFTDNASLSNSFNFRVILPGDHQHFYVFLDDSIPKITSTLSNSLPVTTSTRFFDASQLFHPYNQGNKIQYHIMGNVEYDISGNFHNITTGINMNDFISLKLDNLVLYGLSSFLAGNLFTNLTWDKNKYLTENSSGNITTYVITTGYGASWSGGGGGLSYSCSLELPITNDNFIRGAVGVMGNNVNVNSITNFSDIDQDSYINPPANINFVGTTNNNQQP